MLSQSQTKVRIRDSVSPPAICDGKAIFVEKMRALYGKGDAGGMNEQELELKIELLWNGLKPAQREKFIGKENNTEKSSPTEIRKEPVPMLERRNNCKAIAKVLDLKSTKNATNSYSQVIKGRMKSWWKEGQMINSRVCPPSPPRQSDHPCTSASLSPPLLIVNTDVPDYDAPPSIHDAESESAPKFPTPPATPVDATQKPKVSIKIAPKPAEQLEKKTEKRVLKRKEPLRISAPPKMKKPEVQLMRVVTVVSKGPRVSYEQACQEYYRTLSQSFITDAELLNATMMPAYANIVHGERLIREYKFGHFL